MVERTAYLPADINRDNWGMLFTNTVVWQPVVRHICRQTGHAPATSIEAGYPGSCAVFVVDQALVVKLYPPLFVADFERELVVYEAIQDQILHIPRVLAQGVYADRIDWPYIILSYCPGEPIREVHHLLSRDAKKHIGGVLGVMIRKLHDGPVPGSLSMSWANWRRFLLDNQKRTLSHLRQERPFADQVIDAIEDFLTDTQQTWLAERPLCLINADLTQDHLLLVEDAGTWRVSAVIDWADAEAGVPAYEWIPLWYGLCQQDKELFSAFFSAYDPQQSFDTSLAKQILVYTFLHRFGGEIVIYMLNEHGRPDIDHFADLKSMLLLDIFE